MLSASRCKASQSLRRFGRGALAAAGLGLALGLVGAAPPDRGPSDRGPSWARNIGMSDLEAEIHTRVGEALAARKLDGVAAASLNAKVDALRADEQARRARRDFPEAEFHRIAGDLQDVASQVPTVPPRHPEEPTPTGVDWVQPPAPATLDLTGYTMSFSDDFDGMDIAADGGRGRWYAPVHSSFGEARFIPPGPGGPFRIARAGLLFGPSVLEITARKTADGWRTGLIQSVDGKGRGFAQTYGYFEMRARLPLGHGTWPAFWLLTRDALADDSITRGEIDVLEQYGNQPDKLHSSVHLWPAAAHNAGGVAEHWYKSVKIIVPGMSSGFHRYGVMLTPQTITTYYDGVELAHFPMLAQYKAPVYMLVDLAMHPKAFDQATSPSVMQVDYVRAYAKGT